MKIAQFPHLPQKIKVKVLYHRGGDGYFAMLPEYDVFTEADTEKKLEHMINDLIYELFSVPKELQNRIRYIKEKEEGYEKVKKLIVMSTPDIINRLA